MSNLTTLPKGDSAWLFRKAIERIIQQISDLETNIGSSTTGNSANTQIIFNDNGVLRGDPDLTFNTALNKLVATALESTTSLVVGTSATITGDLTVRSGNKLILNRADNAISSQLFDAGSGAGLTVNNLNGDGFLLKVANNNVYQVGSSYVQTWYDGAGGTRMTLNSTGLGVGVASPSARLHVKSTNGLLINESTGDVTGAGTTFLSLVDANGQAGYYGFAGDGSSSLSVWNKKSGSLLFATGNTLRATIDSTGNVGIAVTPSGTIYSVSETRLVVKGTSNNFAGTLAVQSKGTTNAVTGFLTASDNTNEVGVGSTTNSPLNFYTNNALKATIDASGNVGIGVTSPNGKLEVQESGTGSGIGGIFTSTVSGGGNPGVVFRTASTNRWSLSLTGSAGAESIRFYDINNAATRVTITDAGNFLVGTTNTSATAGVGFKSQFSSTVPQFAIVVNEAGTSTNFSIYNVNAAAYRFYVNNGGTVFATNTTISAISDARLKENVQDIDVGLGAILALKPRKFDWKEGKGKNIKGDRGFIAQEFEQVFPQLVDEWKDAAPEGEAPYKSVRQDLIPVLVKAIQELAAEVNALKNA